MTQDEQRKEALELFEQCTTAKAYMTAFTKEKIRAALSSPVAQPPEDYCPTTNQPKRECWCDECMGGIPERCNKSHVPNAETIAAIKEASIMTELDEAIEWTDANNGEVRLGDIAVFLQAAKEYQKYPTALISDFAQTIERLEYENVELRAEIARLKEKNTPVTQFDNGKVEIYGVIVEDK